jgi:hypothetical protein
VAAIQYSQLGVFASRNTSCSTFLRSMDRHTSDTLENLKDRHTRCHTRRVMCYRSTNRHTRLSLLNVECSTGGQTQGIGYSK